MCFRANYGTKISVIMDCFEIFIESLRARALTWSTYKHHNTVKYLIGIAPQGTLMVKRPDFEMVIGRFLIHTHV